MKIKFWSLLLILCLTLIGGCSGGGEEEKSEVQLKREQREAEFQQGLSKKDISTENDITYGPEVKTKGKDKVSGIYDRPREMRIGVIGPETGELSEFGTKTLEGVLLAAERLNSSGGLNGKKVEIIHYDSGGTPKGASTATAKIITDDNVIAIIGSPTGEITFNATQLANTSHTIFVSAGTRRRLGDSGPYIFRNALPDDIAVKRLMEYALKEKGCKDFALVTSMSNDYSHQLSSLFKSEIFDKGSNLVADMHLWAKDTANISAEEMSIEREIKEIKSKKPQCIIYTGESEEGAQLMREARRQGLDVPMVGSEDLFSHEFIELGKDAVVGSILYTGYSPDWEEKQLKNFIEDYKKKKGMSPDKIAALGYDTFNIIAKAIAEAGSTETPKVRDAMMNLKDFPGITGKTSFNEDREPLKPPFLYKVVKDESGVRFSFIGIGNP